MQLIKGKRAIIEALRSDTYIDRILMDFHIQKDGDILEILQLARQRSIKVQSITKDMIKEQNTQGILAYIQTKKTLSLEDIISNASEYPFIVAVDHIQDSYNFGAILRTCETFNVKAVLYPKDRNCQITPGVIKASSGAIHYLNLVKITNLAHAIEVLKKNGYWIYGADSSQGKDLNTIKPQSPMVLIVGNEDKGIAKHICAKLDEKIKIPMKGHIESLNVSVATGIILYTLSQFL